jgi:hypothetical protein
MKKTRRKIGAAPKDKPRSLLLFRFFDRADFGHCDTCHKRIHDYDAVFCHKLLSLGFATYDGLLSHLELGLSPAPGVRRTWKTSRRDFRRACRS